MELAQEDVMADALFPVIRYTVRYEGVTRDAAMAFWTYREFRVSKDFMTKNDHYRIFLIEFLTEHEIHSEGIHFSRRAMSA